jgi:uracil-DNA glycosylase
MSELDLYRHAIEQCTKCGLSKTRKNFVFGEGSPDADILFVGEAPGAVEDETGIPFVGRAGKLLDKGLKHIGLDRSRVFIANVLKCRPPGNRDPLPEEIALCEPYLHRQIELINPQVIVALGRISARTLLRLPSDTSLTAMKKNHYEYQGVPFCVFFHPAAILRNPARTEAFFHDFEVLKNNYLKD